jgi:hypothetical protein
VALEPAEARQAVDDDRRRVEQRDDLAAFALSVFGADRFARPFRLRRGCLKSATEDRLQLSDDVGEASPGQDGNVN